MKAPSNKRRNESSRRDEKKSTLDDDKQVYLHLVEMNDADESREDIPFVFKELPNSIEEFKKFMGDHDADTLNIMLSRLRDFHDPEAILAKIHD